MPARTLVLASRSPARLALLRAAGFAPQVVVSGVAEDGVDGLSAADAARTLAERKATAVADRLVGETGPGVPSGPGAAPNSGASPGSGVASGSDRPSVPGASSASGVASGSDRPSVPGASSASGVASGSDRPSGPGASSGSGVAPGVPSGSRGPAGLGGAIVLGCDSLLDVDGEVRGKPASADQARDWWRGYRGHTGVLVTGHAVVDVATGRRAVAAAGTTVRFGSPTDDEIEAYVATGEPLAVAGGFTLDGYAAPFVDGIDGDHGTVLGLSLPTLRRLLAEVGIAITSLWEPSP